MTVTAETFPDVHTGNGATTVFPYSFTIPTTEAAVVLLEEVFTGVQTVVPPSEYTITGIGTPSGEVTYPLAGSPIASTHKLIISRDTPITQTTTVSNQTAYFPEVAEGVWDRLTLIAQEAAAGLARGYKVPAGQVGKILHPGAENKTLMFDASGNIIEGPDASQVGQDAADATAAANTATQKAAEASASAANAALSAFNSGTAQAAASNSATAAALSATQAQNSDTSAASSASAASASATASATSATASDASATAAQAAASASETYPYATRAAAEAATVPANVEIISLIHDGHVLKYHRIASGAPASETDVAALTTNGGSVYWEPSGSPTPQHWGFAADRSSGHTAKLQTAVYYAMRQGKILYCPEGEYLLEDEIDGWYNGSRTQPWGIRGAGRDVTMFYFNLNDPTKTLFKFTRGDGTFQGLNQTDKQFGGFSIFRDGGGDNTVLGPCLIDISGYSGTKLYDIFCGSSQNTQIRMSRNANLTVEDVYTNFGGYNFPVLDTSVLTAAGTASGNTVTISGGTPASADHVGMTIFVTGGGVDATVFTITAAPTSSTYTVAETIPETFSGASFVLGAPLVSIGSGSTTMTSNVGIFDAGQIGLFCWTMLNGGGIQRFRITGVTDSKTATITCAKTTGDPLSTPAGFPGAVTNQMIVVAGVEISDYLSTSSAGQSGITNDIFWENSPIHLHSGVSLVVKDCVRVRMPDLKLHGDGSTDWRKMSIEAAWLDNVSMRFEGQVDSTYKGKRRIRFFEVRGQGVSVPHMFTTLSELSSLFWVQAQTGGGFISVGDLRGNFKSFSEVVEDLSTAPSLEVLGTIDGPAFSPAEVRVQMVMPREVRTLAGASMSLTTQGLLVNDAGQYLVAQDNGTFTPVIADAETGGNVAGYTGALGRWVRTGRQMVVSIYVTNIDTTGMTAGSDIWILGSPYALATNPLDRAVGSVMITETAAAAVAPFLANGATGMRLASIMAAGAINFMNVGALTSGTSDIALTMTYETADAW